MRGQPFQATHKANAGFVLMELTGEPLDEYPAPSGRKYKFDNDACQEWVHSMDINYLTAAYGIKRVPWGGAI